MRTCMLALLALAACDHSSTGPTMPDPTTPAGTTPAGTTPAGTTPAASGSKIVVTWGGPGGWGTFAQFTIDENGAAKSEFTDEQAKVTTRTGKVTKADLSNLATVLSGHKLCSLVADPNYMPVPEEKTTTLTVDLPGVSCSVTLHTNEWRKSPDGSAIEQAVGLLQQKVK